MTDINLMLQRLFDKWGFVDLMSMENGWRCADTTDEGLGGPRRFEFYGKTPLQAVQKAYRTISRCFKAENAPAYTPPEPTINAYYMCQMPYENKNTGTASNYNSLTPLNGYVPWPKGKGDTGDKP